MVLYWRNRTVCVWRSSLGEGSDTAEHNVTGVMFKVACPCRASMTDSRMKRQFKQSALHAEYILIQPVLFMRTPIFFFQSCFLNEQDCNNRIKVLFFSTQDLISPDCSLGTRFIYLLSFGERSSCSPLTVIQKEICLFRSNPQHSWHTTVFSQLIESPPRPALVLQAGSLRLLSREWCIRQEQLIPREWWWRTEAGRPWQVNKTLTPHSPCPQASGVRPNASMLEEQ